MSRYAAGQLDNGDALRADKVPWSTPTLTESSAR